MKRREKNQRRAELNAYLRGFAKGRQFRDDEMQDLMTWLGGEVQQFCREVRAAGRRALFEQQQQLHDAEGDQPRVLH